MKLQKNQKRMIVILGIVISYAIFDIITNWEKYNKYYFSSDEIKPTLVTPKTVKKLPDRGFTEVQKLTWKRDPFTEINQKEPVRIKKTVHMDTKLELKAITNDAQSAFVMINDAILMEGETIAGYQVDKIYKNKVKLSKQGNATYLYLGSK